MKSERAKIFNLIKYMFFSFVGIFFSVIQLTAYFKHGYVIATGGVHSSNPIALVFTVPFSLIVGVASLLLVYEILTEFFRKQ